MAKGWRCLVPVWSEADSQSYRPNEDQARRRKTEPGAADLAVTGHWTSYLHTRFVLTAFALCLTMGMMTIPFRQSEPGQR